MTTTAPRDRNYVPALLGVDSTDPTNILPVKINPVTNAILVEIPNPAFATAQFGTSPNYSQFEADGTLVAHGDATTWGDMLGNITNVRSSGPGVSFDAVEQTMDFTAASDLNDYAYVSNQLPHEWKAGSVIHPHIHYQQTSSATPNFLFQYRWQKNNGTKTTDWTNFKSNTNVFTYTSGILNQIAGGGAVSLTPPVGYTISDIVQFRVIRDNANASGLFTGSDTYGGVANITSIDAHYEKDMLGSHTEFTK